MGGGVVLAEAVDEFIKFAEKLSLPVIDFIKRKPDGLALGMNFNIFNAIRYCIKNVISAISSINFFVYKRTNV